MKILNVVQGGEEWLAARVKYFTASEAPAMMGGSKNTTRTELLKMKATGSEKEFSDWVKNVLFERGHEVEEIARHIITEDIGEELFPVTLIDDSGELLASLDGMTMTGDIIWECKQWNEGKADSVRNGIIPNEDYWQVVHQLVVSQAVRAIYTVSDGTAEKTISTEFVLNDEDKLKLLAGWEQFKKDLSDYVHVAEVITPTGKAPESLPALRIEVTGMVTSSNLDAFKAHALAVFAGIKTDLETDEDFASAEKTVKWCGDVEKKLDAAKEHALSQTASIEELFRAIDEIKEEARRKRLDLDKLVKSRKESIRFDILNSGKLRIIEHVNALNERLGRPLMPVLNPDFIGAMKGKKTVSSLRDAVDTELARAKIEANQIADAIQINLNSLRELAADYKFLFSDTPQLITKQNDDLVTLIKLRISEHKEAEQKRIDADREKIRAEEEARAKKAVEKVTVQNYEHAPASQEIVPKVFETKKHPLDDVIDEYLATEKMSNVTAMVIKNHLVKFLEYLAARKGEV